MLFALPVTSRRRSCATARTNALQSPLLAGQCLVHAPITRPRLLAASAPPTSAIAMSETRSAHNESAAFSKNRRLVLRCRILRPGPPQSPWRAQCSIVSPSLDAPVDRPPSHGCSSTPGGVLLSLLSHDADPD